MITTIFRLLFITVIILLGVLHSFHTCYRLLSHFPACLYRTVLQEHVQGFRQPTELSNLLPLSEICELDRVTNRPYFIINKISREIRGIKECASFTARERQGREHPHCTLIQIGCPPHLFYGPLSFLTPCPPCYSLLSSPLPYHLSLKRTLYLELLL
jgi:hypothetical protein